MYAEDLWFVAAPPLDPWIGSCWVMVRAVVGLVALVDLVVLFQFWQDSEGLLMVGEVS